MLTGVIGRNRILLWEFRSALTGNERIHQDILWASLSTENQKLTTFHLFHASPWPLSFSSQTEQKAILLQTEWSFHRVNVRFCSFSFSSCGPKWLASPIPRPLWTQLQLSLSLTSLLGSCAHWPYQWSILTVWAFLEMTNSSQGHKRL